MLPRPDHLQFHFKKCYVLLAGSVSNAPKFHNGSIGNEFRRKRPEQFS
jgi:hypothetical protein